jgi:hypothetical protein
MITNFALLFATLSHFIVLTVITTAVITRRTVNHIPFCSSIMPNSWQFNHSIYPTIANSNLCSIKLLDTPSVAVSYYFSTYPDT